jgi:hypothetical protein
VPKKMEANASIHVPIVRDLTIGITTSIAI